jgi:hypothetical protein
MRRILAGSMFTIAVVCGGWGASSILRTPAPETRSYILSDGKDAGTETFTRTATSLEGDLTIGKRTGQILPNGSISRLEVHGSALGDASAETTVSLVIGRDSATFSEHGGLRVATVRTAAQPGIVPFINPSMAFAAFVVQYARTQKAQSVTVPLLSVDELVPAKIKVTFLTPTTVMLGSLNGARDQLRLVLGADGHIVSAVQGADAKDPFTVRETAPRK